MQKTEESAAETETQGDRCLRLKRKGGVIHAKFFECILKRRIIRTIGRIYSAVNHRRYFPVTGKRFIRRIQSICDRFGTNLIVSGLPLNMDGTEGFQAKKVRDLCAQLEKAGLTVFFQDERLTTVTAEDALINGNVTRTERKGKVDKVAAAIILEQWLHEHINRNGE